MGGGVNGFIDKDNTSSRAMACQKSSGLNVYKISDIDNFENSVIIIFGIHADEIADDFKAYGLTENTNFIKSGLY
jgi:hypothetical protein